MRSSDQTAVSRRTVLRGVVGAGLACAASALAGCDLFPGGGDAQPISPELHRLLSDTVTLANRYDAAIAAAPSLAGTLTALRDAHRAHAQALADLIATDVPQGSAATDVPTDPAELLAALAAAERSGRDAAVTACLAASAREAALLGSIAAARASHLEVLT